MSLHYLAVLFIYCQSWALRSLLVACFVSVSISIRIEKVAPMLFLGFGIILKVKRTLLRGIICQMHKVVVSRSAALRFILDGVSNKASYDENVGA